MRYLSLVAAGCILTAASPLQAQLKPGQLISTVANGTTGEIWIVDTQTRKATQLTLATPARVNTVEMFVSALGWVGTVDSPAKVYRINLSGTKVGMTLLFKNANALLGQTNLSQISRVGATLYFATNPGGSIWRIPLAGGVDPTLVVDLSKVAGWRNGGLANALTSDGRNRVWAAVWSLGEVYVHDIAKKTTSLLMTLPKTKGSSSNAFFPVQMRFRKAGTTELIDVFGLYGDVVVIDPNKKTVVAQYFHPTARGTGMSSFKNSGVWNPDQGHWDIGSRDGALDSLLPVGTGQLARRVVEKIGNGANPLNNSVNGIWYQAGGASYAPFDAGCAGTGGFFPTSTGLGLPKAGNSGFAFGVFGLPAGQNLAILLLGSTKIKVGLGGIGLSSCNLLTVPLLVLAVPTSSGTVNGLNSARIPIPLPSGSFQLQTQWLIFHVGNKKFDATSDGRTLK